MTKLFDCMPQRRFVNSKSETYHHKSKVIEEQKSNVESAF